jgi:hypothetical protein
MVKQNVGISAKKINKMILIFCKDDYTGWVLNKANSSFTFFHLKMNNSSTLFLTGILLPLFVIFA